MAKGKIALQPGIFSKHPTVEPCYLDLYIKGNEKQFEISQVKIQQIVSG